MSRHLFDYLVNADPQKHLPEHLHIDYMRGRETQLSIEKLRCSLKQMMNVNEAEGSLSCIRAPWNVETQTETWEEECQHLDLTTTTRLSRRRLLSKEIEADGCQM